jgi:WD40 repeat protein
VSDDGDTAVVASPPADGIVVVDLAAGEVSATFTAGAPPTDVDIDPTGGAIVVARQDGIIEIRSLTDLGEPLQIETGVDVRLVRWSPSQAAIAAVTDTSTVQFWDVATGELRWSSETGDDVNVLVALPTGALFSPDGDVLVVDSGLLTPIVRSYRTTDGDVAFPPTRRVDGESGVGTIFWRDVERWHLSVASIKSLSTYDLTTGLEVGDRIERFTFFDAVHSETLGEIVAVGSQLMIRAADGAGPLERSIPLSDEQRAVADEGGTIHPAISPDGARVLVSALGGLDLAPTTAFDLTSPMVAPADFPYDDRLVYGNGAFTFTFGGTPLGFTLLDEDDQAIGEFPLTFDTIDADASADGRFVAIAKSNGLIDLYAGSGEFVHQFDLGLPAGTSGEIVIPGLSDDGRFVSASNWTHAAVWSTDTFERIDGGRFVGQTRIAHDLLANRDDGVVRLYSLPDLEPVGQPMINEPGGHFYPALDPVHGRLAVTSQDAVSIYDIETGRQIGNRLSYRPIRVEYTADGTELVVAGDDRVTVWNYDTDTWDDIACDVAGRNLTTEEWEQLGPRTIDHRATCAQYPIDE